MNAFTQTILPLFNQTRSEWLSEARKAAYLLAITRGWKGSPPELTTDDIHKHCPLPDGIDPRVMGAVFRTNQWRKVGYINSTRATCHNRPIAIFQLV